jgi:hypothetical protein
MSTIELNKTTWNFPCESAILSAVKKCSEGIQTKFKILKKLVSCAIVTAMVTSAMAGCGSNTNIEDTEVSETEVAEATESVVTEVATETEKESEETTEEVDTEAETETEEASEVDVETTSSTTEETPAHTHAWDSGTVTQAATCTSNGVKTYSCSCGQTKTEAIGATGHNWVAQTTVVHHDAEGMYQQVKTGDRKVVYCYCGEKFYDNESYQAHANENDHHRFTLNYEDTYETKWVETQAAYDETVTTGYICSVCGATQ